MDNNPIDVDELELEYEAQMREENGSSSDSNEGENSEESEEDEQSDNEQRYEEDEEEDETSENTKDTVLPLKISKEIPKACDQENIPQFITVDHYGKLHVPASLCFYHLDEDCNSFRPVTGWARVDDFKYLFTLSIEPLKSRCDRNGRWIRFATVMRKLGSKKDNKKCQGHVRICKLS